MGKLIRTVIIGVVLVAGAYFALDAHDKQVTELAYDLELASLRGQYVERAGWVRSIESTERWRDEFVSLNRWYDAQWTALHNRFPGRSTSEAVLAGIEAESLAGAKPQETALKKEFFEHTLAFHKLLSGGRYVPIDHHVSNGVRIDLLDMKKETHDGQRALRVDLVIWGAPRETIESKVQGETMKKVVLDFALNALSLEFIDEKDKLIGGGDTRGPEILIDYPERWVPSFLPQAAIATWWIEPMPQATKTVLLKIDGAIRSGAVGAMPVNMEWRLPARDGWKLGEGQAFEGDERVMPEEAMDRSR